MATHVTASHSKRRLRPPYTIFALPVIADLCRNARGP